ncbi:MAG: hypothetical protein IPK22_26185 [Verrucomicrobiaceae bacterium]|nr:hypothetical protein [Verrucomicrobiaceae bacterium]
MHWGVVQGIAWARMLVSYAGEASLMQAVEMTFDGEHPCELCQMARKAQNKPAPQSPTLERPRSNSSPPPARPRRVFSCLRASEWLSRRFRALQLSRHEPEKPQPRRG